MERLGRHRCQYRDEHCALQAVAKRWHFLLQGTGQCQAIRRCQYQVPRYLGLLALQHARIQIGGEIQLVRHAALQRLQHQQLVVGIQAQHADGTDAVLAGSEEGLVLHFM